MKMYVLGENYLGIHLDGGIDICIEWKIPRLGNYDIEVVIYRCNRNTPADDDYRSLTESQASTNYPKQYELLKKAYENNLY